MPLQSFKFLGWFIAGACVTLSACKPAPSPETIRNTVTVDGETFTGTVAAQDPLEPQSPELMPRFKKTIGDYSGTATADIQWLADREAIRNLINSYGHTLDDDHFDAFLDTYTDDGVIQISGPCWGNFSLNGKAAIRYFVDGRFSGRIIKVQGRHTMAMVNVSDQTKNSALVRTQAVLSGTLNNGVSKASSGRASYNFWVVKQDGRWKIKKQYIELDGFASPSPLPEGANFTPDNREICKAKK